MDDMFDSDGSDAEEFESLEMMRELAAAAGTTTANPHMAPGQTRFMRPLMSTMVLSAPRRRGRRAPAPAPAPAADRERDRSPEPVDAPAAQLPDVIVESDQLQRVNALLGPAEDITKCFACRFARGEQITPAANTGIEMIQSTIRSMTAGQCRIAVAIELWQIFEKHIRGPMLRCRKEGELECPEWPKRLIYDHYFTPFHNRLDAITSHESRALVFEQAFHKCDQYLLYEEVTLSNGTKIQVPRDKTLTQMMKLSSELTKLYQLRPSTFSLAANEAPTTTLAPGVVDSRRTLIGPSPHLRQK